MPVATFALVLLLAASGTLESQSRAELEARLSRLRGERNALDSAVAHQRARDFAQRDWRTSSAGRMVVVYETADASLGQAAVKAGWQVLVRRFGPGLGHADTLRIRLSRVRRTPRGTQIPIAERPLEVGRSSRPRPGTAVTTPVLPAPVTVEDVVGAIALIGGEQVWASLDSALARWRPAIPGSVTPERQRQRTYVQLASSPFEGGRLCFAGDLASCARMLGLVGNPGDFVSSYTPQERRQFVKWIAQGYLENSLQGMVAACTDRLDQASCDSLLAWRPADSRRLIPLDQDARGLLIDVALEAGGDGAFDRLLSDHDRPIAERLGAAARLPADSLVSRWRAAALGGRPEQVAVTRGSGWAALGWSLLLFGLALGSSRWR